MKTLIVAVFLSSLAPAKADFSVSPEIAFRDNVVLLRASELRPYENVKITAELKDVFGETWSASTFVDASQNGTLEIQANSLFWSLLPAQPADRSGGLLLSPAQQSIVLTLSRKDAPSETKTLVRRVYDEDKTERVLVRDGIVGNYYRPKDGKRHPAILVLGGSEGGIFEDRAAMLSVHGYATLSLAYFRYKNLPEYLLQIPLEYFMQSIDWLKEQPDVDPQRIAVSGFSKGAELALLLGAYHSDIKAVVSVAPTWVVWEGIGQPGRPPGVSSWSLNTKDVPFTSYINDPSDFSGPPPYSIRKIYERSVLGISDEDPQVIPVEKIQGEILLISGEDDQIWPSTSAAMKIEARLKAKNFAFNYYHHAYRDAGHNINVPYDPAGIVAFGALALGGTTEGNAYASADSWAKTLSFLKDALN